MAWLWTDVISSSFHAHNALNGASMIGMIPSMFRKQKIVKNTGEIAFFGSFCFIKSRKIDNIFLLLSAYLFLLLIIHFYLYEFENPFFFAFLIKILKFLNLC